MNQPLPTNDTILCTKQKNLPCTAWFALLLVLLLQSHFCFADKNSSLYLSPRLTYITLEGEFDGARGYQGLGEAAGSYVTVPKVDNTMGYGLVLGSRINQLALEIGHLRSDHDVVMFGYPSTANYRIFNLDMKYFFRPGATIQPYLGMGLAYHSLRVKEGAFTATSISEAEFHAWGLNFPLGVSISLSRKLSLTGGVVGRALEFKNIGGIKGEMNVVSGAVQAHGYYFDLGLNYAF